MHKFIAVVIAVFTLSFSASAAFANNPWEGVFTKASKQGDVWTASVTIRATGAKLVKQFAECRKVSGGYECRNQIEGGSPAPNIEVEIAVVPHQHNHNVDIDSGNTTPFAVFHPLRYVNYVPPGRRNVWNLTSEPQMRDICRSAGGDCVIVTAPLNDPLTAVRIAKSKTHWPL